jgi:hypothetical protein
MKQITKTKNVINTREELIYALSEAAEIEHGLTCAYLFTAFSMKQFTAEGIDEIQQDQIRNWKSVILRVSHQEMEHLGLVCNLLNAIGGPQHFDRPNMPQPKAYYQTAVDMQLSKFSLDTLAAYMAFEKPDITPHDNYQLNLNQIVPTPIVIHNGHTVQELYEAIMNGFINLNKAGNLFIGNPKSQVDDATLGIGFSNKEYGINLTEVTNLEQAIAAIRRIIEQGEGVILVGDNVKIENKALTELYMQLDKVISVFSAYQLTETNWSAMTKELAELANVMIQNLKKSSKLIQHPDNRKIVEHSIQPLTELSTKIYEIGKHPFSTENKEEVEKLQNRFKSIVLNDNEGAIIYELVEEKNCHYLAFWNLYQELKKEYKDNTNFEPSRNVADNPMLNTHPEAINSDKITLIEHPYTRQVLELFNAGYETMVDMLIIFYNNDGLSKHEHKMFKNTAFFPFMTMFIRPVGEILTMLPIKEDAKTPIHVHRAGGSFEYYINTALMPRTNPRWTYLTERLEQMVALSAKLQKPDEKLKKYMPEYNFGILTEQMSVLSTNLKRINENFRLGMSIK